MMRSFFSIFLIGTILISLSCKRPSKGALSVESRTALDSLADRSIEVEAKYLFVIDTYELLLAEALRIQSDDEAIDHLRIFYEENKSALTRLESEFEGWYRRMEHDERINFFIRYRQLKPNNIVGKRAEALKQRFSNEKSSQKYVPEVERLIELIKLKYK